jgi:hypothetical protein
MVAVMLGQLRTGRSHTSYPLRHRRSATQRKDTRLPYPPVHFRPGAWAWPLLACPCRSIRSPRRSSLGIVLLQSQPPVPCSARLWLMLIETCSSPHGVQPSCLSNLNLILTDSKPWAVLRKGGLEILAKSEFPPSRPETWNGIHLPCRIFPASMDCHVFRA